MKIKIRIPKGPLLPLEICDIWSSRLGFSQEEINWVTLLELHEGEQDENELYQNALYDLLIIKSMKLKVKDLSSLKDIRDKANEEKLGKLVNQLKMRALR